MSLPWRRLALLSLAAAPGLAGCGGPPFTAAELENALQSTFANLYAQQQTILGHPGATAVWAGPGASCRPAGGPGSGGAGLNWACTVTWRAWNGAVTSADYDVEVRPEGCYTATGPASVVGPSRLPRPGGGTTLNPLLIFDGCFPT
jgi:hypothetical protein